MQVRVSAEALGNLVADALVVPVFTGGQLDGAARSADEALGGALTDVIESGEISGKPFEVSLLHTKQLGARRVLAIGLGERGKFVPSVLAKYAGTAVRYLGKRNVRTIAIALPAEAAADPAQAASFVVEGAIAGTIDATLYRTEPDKPVVTEAVVVLAQAGDVTFDTAALEAGARRGEIVGEAVNVARRMALTPGNDMTPTHMAERAREVAETAGLAVEVIDEDRMRELGMGALLGVSAGSDQPAKLIVLRYDGNPGSDERLALVGKGLTFDSGGISIKAAENMHEMKYDMSGGAGVIGAMLAIGRLKPQINVIGIVPSSENLPGPRAMKPGDILRAMNGKTIEVLNTDAEGRLILADALAYAKTLGATKIVDAATLTGAMVVALGHAASGAMSNDQAFADEFLAAANASGERYWQMPLYEEYTTAVKSEIADLRNSAGRAAGSLTAASFLKSFVGDTPWIHLDIAGTAYLDSESSFLAKGPTGTPVRAFVAYAEAAAKTPPGGNGAVTTNGTVPKTATV